MHDIVCFVFYQSSVLVIEVIIGDMSKKKVCVCVCVMCVCVMCVNMFCLCSFTNGSQYRGWWHQGSQHGYGELIHMDQESHKKESYFGAWFQGRKDGYGIWDSEQT